MTSILHTRARDLRRNSTEAELLLWRHLKGKQLLGLKFRRQTPIGNYIADFVCHEAQVIVEVDGGQHGEQKGYDDERTKWLEGQGYRVLRFWNHEVLQNVEVVLEVIRDGCVDRAPSPHPSPTRGEGV